MFVNKIFVWIKNVRFALLTKLVLVVNKDGHQTKTQIVSKIFAMIKIVNFVTKTISASNVLIIIL